MTDLLTNREIEMLEVARRKVMVAAVAACEADAVQTERNRISTALDADALRFSERTGLTRGVLRLWARRVRSGVLEAVEP